MIQFDRFVLSNGLKVIHHQDNTTPLATVNVLYNVGAKDEYEDKTGFAHFFEHLMFSGSVNIPDFDEPLQKVGGENNAFTTNDFTNYYITLPVSNIETALWLESDRMLGLSLSEESFEVERNVVIEEYKQRFLNQPYGDVWLLLRPLAYKAHPYRWATIGADISHIEKATIADAKDFYYAHYAPNNAIVSIVANLPTSEVKTLMEKWFGSIPSRELKVRNLPKEPQQSEAQFLEVERDVPFDSIYKVYKMGKRSDRDFHAVDLLSDVLSNGDSSRFFSLLVKKLNLFTNLDAYLLGDLEPSLFVISGNLRDGVSLAEAEAAISKEIDRIRETPVSEQELQKVKNKVEAALQYASISPLNKAINLATYELQSKAEDFNEEGERYQSVTPQELMAVAYKILREENCSTLHYKAKRK